MSKPEDVGGEKSLERIHETQDSGRDTGIEESFDPVATKNLVWKQDLKIVPLAAAIYLLCFLDRSNIGEFERKLAMQTF